MRVAVILGTRPEIVKMSPIIRELQRRMIDHVVIHTGQHYDYDMDGAFFKDLELAQPNYNLKVGSGTHADQTAKIMLGVEEILIQEAPSVTLVQGDTNTVLAGAIVASKLHLRLGHVEAGLRSFDKSMPEEINRIIADHVSDILFAPTKTCRNNLLKEGVNENSIQVTGNTVVDALQRNLGISQSKSNIIKNLGVEDDFFLATLHRAENVDDEVKLHGILFALRQLGESYGVKVIFPVHPRARKMIDAFNLSTEGIVTTDPLGYLDFLQLENKAKLILTDSGGVQEESCILGVPCVTLRENTERPETVEVGANIIAGTDPPRIVSSAAKMLEANRSWANPFGEGDTGIKIVKYISG